MDGRGGINSMSGTELEQFRKRTRWVYYRDGVAYGPFSVDEILDMIDEGVLGRETDLMELGSNRRSPLSAVRLFLERVRELDERCTREMEEAEFEVTRRRLGRSRGVQFYLVHVALPLILVLAVAFGVFRERIFGTGDNGHPGAVHVAAEVSVDGHAGEPSEAGAKVRSAEAEFVEAEPSLEAGLEDYALGLTMVSAGNEDLEAHSHVPVAASAKKLPEVVVRPRRKKAGDAMATGGAQAASGPASAGGGVVEMDFSAEVLGEDAAATVGGGVEAMVRRRLRPVLRKCAGKGAGESGLPPDVMAMVQVRSTGSLGSLKLVVEPNVGYSEIRMCVVAGMAGIRVPAFDGPAVSVTTTN